MSTQLRFRLIRKNTALVFFGRETLRNIPALKAPKRDILESIWEPPHELDDHPDFLALQKALEMSGHDNLVRFEEVLEAG